ncbi:hypothetical protein TMatcc_000146 [Talaromyces marneffei ATCC 18224]
MAQYRTTVLGTYYLLHLCRPPIRLITNPAVYSAPLYFFSLFTASFSLSLGWPAITNNHTAPYLINFLFYPIDQPRFLTFPHLLDYSLCLSRVWLVHRDATCLDRRHRDIEHIAAPIPTENFHCPTLRRRHDSIIPTTARSYEG